MSETTNHVFNAKLFEELQVISRTLRVGGHLLGDRLRFVLGRSVTVHGLDLDAFSECDACGHVYVDESCIDEDGLCAECAGLDDNYDGGKWEPDTGATDYRETLEKARKEP